MKLSVDFYQSSDQEKQKRVSTCDKSWVKVEANYSQTYFSDHL